MNTFHIRLRKTVQNLTVLQWFQLSLLMNALLFVYTIYGYNSVVATTSATQFDVSTMPAKIQPKLAKDLQKALFPDESSHLTDSLEEINIPNMNKKRFLEVKANVPVMLSGESQWSKNFQVPNVVHYVWFNDKAQPLQFHHMLSIISAYKFLSPVEIKFHCDREPTGKYWRRVQALPRFKVVHRSPPKTLFGEKVKDPMFYTSHSNVDRLKILMEEGGIYLDLDVLVIKSFDDLRHYVCTIGQEQLTKACGSIIICSNSSVFLRIWINSFLDDYRMDEWAYNTGQVPFNLARRFPTLVNMEKNGLNRPNFKELHKIWGPKAFNWKENYAVHIWYRLWKDRSKFYKGVEPNDINIKTWPGAFGEMARAILFGSSDQIKE